MNQMDEYRSTAPYVDVTAGSEDMRHTVYRFPNDETGHARAVEYRNAYNKSLRAAMNIPEADLELESPDYSQRPGEYDRAMQVAMYRSESAGLSYVHTPEVIGNEAPLPTDYPHEF